MSRDARIGRRALLAGLGASLASGTARARSGFETVELRLEPARNLPRRCSLVLPLAAASEASLPLLVLLHGLGETKDEGAGIRAWLGPYGLARAWERLEAPPLAREKEPYWSEAELSELNGSLAVSPFRKMVVACPFMPNPSASPGGIARYARWVETVLLPAIRERAPSARRDARGAGICGVSLGGYVSLEVFLQKPELFATAGSVQGAFSSERAVGYAARLAKVASERPLTVFVSSSSADPYRRANERLHRELTARAVPARLSIRRGPHSQGWLREVGSVETLLWHDRALRGSPELGEVRAP